MLFEEAKKDPVVTVLELGEQAAARGETLAEYLGLA